MQLNVGVIGAGTAGPAAALLLERQGHRVTLLERAPSPAPIGAGITLQPTGLSILRALGLEERIIARGSRIDRLFGRTRTGRTVLDLSYAHFSPRSFGLGIHRGELFTALMSALRASSVRIRTGVEVERVAEEANAARVVTALGDELAFDLLVVADGARSRLREQVAAEVLVKPYEWGALWSVLPCSERLFEGARYAHPDPRRTLTQVFDGTTRFVGFLPTGKEPETGRRVTSLFWSIRCRDMDAFVDRGVEHFKDQVLELAPGVEPLLDELTDPSQLLSARYYDVATRPQPNSRMVLLGDAAHAMSPQLGQGANLALYDAWVLADSVRLEPGNVPRALARFHESRRANLRFYEYATRLLTPFFQSDAAPLGYLRDLTMGALCRLPFFRRQGLGAMVGLKAGIFSTVPVSRVFA